MKIEINNNRKIFAIQEAFTAYFPYLKMEFYAKSSRVDGPPSDQLVKSSSKSLADCRTSHHTGTISILPGMTAGELKQSFRDVFGLSVVLFHVATYGSHMEVQLPDNSVLEEFNKNEAISLKHS